MRQVESVPITDSETARELQVKSVLKRQQNVQKLKDECAKLPLLQDIATSVARDSISTGDLETFRSDRRARVRKQLDLIDRRITEETLKPRPDGQQLNWLCTAQARLSEQERVLSGRPLPGSLRPKGKQRERDEILPTDPTPGDNPAEEKQPLTGLSPLD